MMAETLAKKTWMRRHPVSLENHKNMVNPSQLQTLYTFRKPNEDYANYDNRLINRYGVQRAK